MTSRNPVNKQSSIAPRFSLAGHVIVATSMHQGGVFEDAVCIVVEHTAYHAIGLMLNRSAYFDPKLKRAMEKLPSAQARSASAMFQLCGQTLSEKVDSILTKTVKANAIKAASCILSMCPSTLQTPNMVATDVIKSVVPLIDPLEWERYITLPAQTPPPTKPSLFQLGRYCYVCHTPSASQIELKSFLFT